MFAPGDKLEYGHYTVLRELGAGGMGVVYHCRDEFLQREIAIKMLLPELMADDDTVDIFRLEARLAAQLEHPNIVTIHNIGIENKESKVHHYIAMEFLPGGSLKQRIESNEPIALEQALEWMKQMTTGVHYAHKRGVVHQDIKPDNVFITHDGNLKIGDFGLALIASGVAVERAVQGKGTPAYMSPELCRGDPQDYRSDIYSLGAVFYELLTCEKPYKASGMIEMAMKHATAPVPSAKKLNPEVPEVLDKAIQKMMAKTADERFASLAEVLTILEKLLLEMQVARLGMGQLNIRGTEPVAVSTAAPPKESKPAPAKRVSTPAAPEARPQAAPAPATKSADVKPPTPQPASDKKSENAPKPQKPAQPVASADKSKAKKGGALDELDDLLDMLLAEKDDGKSKAKRATIPIPAELEETGPARIVAPPSAVKAAPQPAAPPKNSPAPSTAASKPPAAAAPKPKAEPQKGFNEDVTIDIDSVLQSKIRSEAAALAAQGPEASVQDLAESNARAATDKAAERRSSPSSALVTPKQQKLKTVWSYKTQGPIGWTSCAVLSKDKKFVYIGSSDGRLYALDATTGGGVWRYDAGAAIVSSPVVSSESIYVAASDGTIHALDFNGGTVWKASLESPLVATPLEYNNDLIVASMDGSLRFINHKDGSVKWTYRTEGPLVSPPQLLDKNVFVTSKDRSLHAVSVDRGWRQWTFTTQAPIVCSPLVATDSVYFGSTDGSMYAVEAESGKQIWQYSTEKPIVARGTLEFNSVTVCSEDKYVHCVDRFKGTLIWKSKLNSPVLSELVSSGGNLYVANREGWLQCFNLKNGELNWQLNCEARVESSPVVSGKNLYVANVNGYLTAYALP